MPTDNHINGFRKPIAYQVGGVYGGVFLYIGIIMPFWALWLAKVGMTPGEISFLIGFPSFLKVMSSPFIAQLCDKWGMVRRPMLALMAIAALSFCGYFVFSSFWAYAVVTIIFAAAFTGFLPLLESFAVRAADRYDLQYGRLRAVGSIVFVLTSVAFGYYLDYFGYDHFLYFCLGALVTTFFAVVLLPKEQKPKVTATEEEDADHEPALRFLLTSREFIMFLVVLSLIQMSHGLVYVMGSLHWERQGINNQTIGLLWSLGVVAEIVVFIFCGSFIRRFRPMYVLATIGVLGAMRWAVLATTASVPLLALAQTMHGLTYGAAHLVAMYYLSSRVPDRYFTTAQSLYSSVPLGLAQGSVMLLAGPLYARFEGQGYYVMAFFCLSVLFIARFVRRVAKDGSESN
ncbi:MFS transporter [Paremcibacter congregatus]|uniref:MFS transporter n=1 Tax=Paremcibacter congregatus TaxID=2043170 RepID=UPI003A8E80AC